MSFTTVLTSVPEKYPYPTGFNPGDCERVRNLNEFIQEGFDSLGRLTNMWIDAQARIHRYHFPTARPMPVYKPDPHISYSIKDTNEAVRKLKIRREQVLGSIELVIQYGGIPFLVPHNLESAVSRIIGPSRPLAVEELPAINPCRCTHCQGQRGGSRPAVAPGPSANDSKDAPSANDSKDAASAKDSKDAAPGRSVKDSKDTPSADDSKDTPSANDSKDAASAKDSKDASVKDSKDAPSANDSKDAPSANDSKDAPSANDSKDAASAKDSKDAAPGRAVKDSKDALSAKDSKEA